ncbi:TetR/AcrR family transcriptional regulator [Kineococcus sp. GCM10028916]|uniref:TetR/AcrR family transcriptional regulator n=1 Tax=Kineococcus sp. GCM10028916 TaxID=3273394 RepID=UPI003631FDE8
MDARDRLISATQELLWVRGYAATSPKEIQTSAGAGQGSMYHHFHGKEDLAVAALQRSARLLRDDSEALLQAPGTAVERLTSYLRQQRDSLRGCRMGRMTYDADVLATPALLEPVTATLDWLVTAIAEVIRQGVEDRELQADTDPEALACTVAAVVQGGYVLARAHHDTSRFDAAVEGAVALLNQAHRG